MELDELRPVYRALIQYAQAIGDKALENQMWTRLNEATLHLVIV